MVLLPSAIFNENQRLTAFILEPLDGLLHLEERLGRILRYIVTEVVFHILFEFPRVIIYLRYNIIDFVPVRKALCRTTLELSLILCRAKL